MHRVPAIFPMKKFPFLFIFLFLVAGCSIFGVHFKIHNPHRAGKFPKKTEARVLLGNQDSKFRTCFDVKYYNLFIHFGNDLLKDRSIWGDVLLSAKALIDFDTLQLDLAKHMVFGDVKMLNHPEQGNGAFDHPELIETIRKDGAVFLIMHSKVKAGQNFTLSIHFSGEPTEAKKAPWSGGFVRTEDDLKKPWWGVACEGEGASSWWPCKDVMNDEPDSVDITLSVPPGLKAISNGKLVSEFKMSDAIPGANDRTQFSWHISYPINIYNITFYIGNYKLLHDTYYSEITHDTLQLNHYVLEQNYEKAKTHFQQLKKYLAFYEETFGPYPWYRDGFKLVESPYAGMEHQSAIAYGNGYINDPQNGFDYIILHETAHEWWGNSVTANDLAEAWIHEGFATYAEALYVEKTKGHEAYLNYLLNYRILIVNRRPIIGEKGTRYFNYKDGDIYMKGAWVLHSLRYAVGSDSLFMDILHSFYMENKYSQIGSEKLEELVNRKTGKDFHWFFEQYLHNRFTPELEYCLEDNVIYYRWNPKYTNPDFTKMEIEVLSKPYIPSKSEAVNPNGLPAGTRFALGTITPSKSIQSQSVFNSGVVDIRFTDVVFNNEDALYKVVENKNLLKEFRKQK
jgi:hypothetical protein